MAEARAAEVEQRCNKHVRPGHHSVCLLCGSCCSSVAVVAGGCGNGRFAAACRRFDLESA